MTTKKAYAQKDYKGYQVTINEFIHGTFSNCHTLHRNLTKKKAENIANTYNENFAKHNQLNAI